MNTSREKPAISRWILLTTVFITGACVLVIEIIGTRILSPFFGSGIYTWSSLIATTLAALSLGYAIGGRYADRYPYPAGLYSLCFTAGLWTAITPWLAVWMLPYLVNLPDMRIGILLSSLILFFPNLFLLGAIGPFTIRLISDSTDTAGTSSGLIFSISTVGSLLAAIAAGFILLPNFGVLAIFSICGYVLIALAAAGFTCTGSIKSAITSAAILIISVYHLSTYSPTGSNSLLLLESKPSFYGHIQVIQKRGYKALLVDGIGQNYVAENKTYSTNYINFISLLPLLRDTPASINNCLVIGIGAGQLPMLLTQKGHIVDAVDVDPDIEIIASKHFGFNLPKNHVFISDGRQYLVRNSKLYDFIVLDAFNSDQVAAHLLSAEALETAKHRLTEHGMLVINFTSNPKSEDVASLQVTLNTVFPHVRLFHQGKQHGLSSLVFTASSQPINLSTKNPQLSHEQLSTVKQFINGELGDLGGKVVLSDNFNPISYQRREIQIQWRREMRDYLGDDQALLLFN